MKLSNPNSESFEFNLQTVNEKRCCSAGLTGPCSYCESCLTDKKITDLKSWIEKAGNQSRRRLMLGLIRRVRSVEALTYLKNLLQSVLSGKDYTYARIRTNPNLETDRWTTSGDRVLNAKELESEIQSVWRWFEQSDYYTKVNFLLKIMKFCESQLIFLLLKQIQTQLVQDLQTSIKDELPEPLPLEEGSDYSFHTEDHSELDLLVSAKPYYSKIICDSLGNIDVYSPNAAQHDHGEIFPEHHRKVRAGRGVWHKAHPASAATEFPKDNNGRPWTPRSLKAYRYKEFELIADTQLMDKSLREIQHEREERYKRQDAIIALGQQLMQQQQKRPKSGSAWHRRQKRNTGRKSRLSDDSADDSDRDTPRFGGLSPECYVTTGANKAYVGVTERLDFISQLPVHLSKYILSYLPVTTIRACQHVSQHWHVLASEVLKERVLCNQMKVEIKQIQVASRGCNPLYAKDIDVLVPNVAQGSNHCIRIELPNSAKAKSPTAFDAELDNSELGEDGDGGNKMQLTPMQKAYEGYSTRKIIMEERNVFCGAFNVMVLADQHDNFRVVHSSGGRTLGQSYLDRRIMFVDCKTGRPTGPIIIGHAGTIRCLELLDKRGLIFSGSYDTSIRCWSVTTGKCQKIYRGHNGTVTCLHTRDTRMISGGKDGQCRVWDILSGNCKWTARQQNPVSSVQLGEDLCVSGSEDAKVYIWDVKTGVNIKKLTLHTANVTAVRLDKWHVVSASADGYAYMWSTQGDHDQPLITLKHNCPVLCLEFMYLRAITGAADGKLRIWNVLNGQCIRILRGNSKNEPIYQIVASSNRLLLNTPTYLLALNFEPVELNYTLENDSMPPLVMYAKYRDAPLRDQPYSYIRAQRMRSAGATNRKLVSKSACSPPADGTIRKRVMQLPHSALVLSENRLKSARRVQSGKSERELPKTVPIPRESKSAKSGTASFGDEYIRRPYETLKLLEKTQEKIQIGPQLSPEVTAYMKLTGDLTGTMPTDEEDSEEEEVKRCQRRMSWTFEQMPQDGSSVAAAAAVSGEAGQMPEMPSLADTKSMLRTQMRMKIVDIAPPYILQKIDSMHANLRADKAAEDIVEVTRHRELEKSKQADRPMSSPGWIDPRMKVSIAEQKQKVRTLQFAANADLLPDSRDTQSLADAKIRHVASAGSVHQAHSDFDVTKKAVVTQACESSVRSETSAKPPPVRMSCAEYRDELKSIMASAAQGATCSTPAHRRRSASEVRVTTSALKKRSPTFSSAVRITSPDGQLYEEASPRQQSIANVPSSFVRSGFSIGVPSIVSCTTVDRMSLRSAPSCTVGKDHQSDHSPHLDKRRQQQERAKTASVTSIRDRVNEVPKDINTFVPILFYSKEVRDKVEKLKLRQQQRSGFAVSSDFFEEKSNDEKDAAELLAKKSPSPAQIPTVISPISKLRRNSMHQPVANVSIQEQEPSPDPKKEGVYADMLRRNSGFRLLTNTQEQAQIAVAQKPAEAKCGSNLNVKTLQQKSSKSIKSVSKISNSCSNYKVNVSSMVSIL